LNYKLIIIFIFVYNLAFSQPAEIKEELNTEALRYRDLKQNETYNIYIIKNDNFESTLCLEIKQITVNDTIYLITKNYNEFNIVIQNYEHLNNSEREPDDNNIVINKQITQSKQDLAYDNWATVEINNSGINWELFQKGYENNKTLIDAGESALQFTIALLEIQLGGEIQFYRAGEKLILEGSVITTKSGVEFTKSTMQLGQEMHKAFKIENVIEGVAIKEFRGIPGIRPDFVDFATQTIYELKPYNPRALQKGIKQLDNYKYQIELNYGGMWKMILETY